MADEEHLTYRLHTPTDRDRTAASDGITPPHDDEDRSANVGGSSGSYSSSAGSNPSRSRSGVAAQPGHEGAFVQPASYLRPRGFSYPMAPVQPERAIDQEEQMGLVSRILILEFLSTSLFFAPGPLRFAGLVGVVSYATHSGKMPFAANSMPIHELLALETMGNTIWSLLTPGCCSAQFAISSKSERVMMSFRSVSV